MSRFIFKPIFIFSAAMLLSLSACTDSPQEEASPTADIGNDTEVVARVNDEIISRAALQQHIQSRSSNQQPISPKIALEELINLTLLKQEAVRRDLNERAEVIAEIERQRTAVLANQLVQEQTQGLEISEENLQQEYAQQVANLPKEYHARHILVKTEDEAKSIIDALQKGADFSALAAEKSIDPSGKNGGDLEWFNLDSMVPEFAAAVAELEAGKITTTPVQTEYGWHVIKLEGVRDFPKPSFDEVRDQLRHIIMNKRLSEYMEKLREDAKIEVSTAAAAPSVSVTVDTPAAEETNADESTTTTTEGSGD